MKLSEGVAYRIYEVNWDKLFCGRDAQRMSFISVCSSSSRVSASSSAAAATLLLFVVHSYLGCSSLVVGSCFFVPVPPLFSSIPAYLIF